MAKSSKTSLVLIDATGAAIVLGCLGAAFWFTMIGNRDTASEIHRLKSALHDARQDQARLLEVRKEQDRLLKKNRVELEQRGPLPERTPVEEYFQTVAALTVQHHLRVLRQNPLATQHYPGLREHRFVYVVAGSTQELARFLRSIEETSFWADVSYLKIATWQGDGPGAPGQRVAELTLSLFSAPLDESETEEG